MFFTKNKPRSISLLQLFFALLLSVCFPGFGHLYLGRSRVGGALLAVPIFFLGSKWLGNVPIFVILFILTAGAWLLSIVTIIPYSRKGWKTNGGGLKWWCFPPLLLILYSAYFFSLPFGNVRAFEVADQNMEPSILLGDRILVDTTAYQDAPIKRGDIVAFRFPLQPNQIWLKRVIGLPGEEVRSDGSLMQINGEPVTNEPIIGLQPLMSIYGGIKGDELLYRRLLKCHWEEVDSRKYAIVYDGNPVRKKAFFYKSKENEFFLLGDRRDKSIDSRDFGPVTKESIIGKVHSIWRSENTHRIGVYKEIGSKE